MRTTADIVHELRTHASLGSIDLDTVRQIVNPQELGPPREVVGFGMPEPTNPNKRKQRPWETYHEAIQDAFKMYEWAKAILGETKQSPTHAGQTKYVDWKRTSAASGIGYLAVLCAFDALEIRISRKRSNLYQVSDYVNFISSLPKPYDRELLLSLFNETYMNLHVYGYYRYLTTKFIIDSGMDSAAIIIKSIDELNS